MWACELAARHQREGEQRLDVGLARQERTAGGEYLEGRRGGAAPVGARTPSHAQTLQQRGGTRRGVGPLAALLAQRPTFVVARRAGGRVS